ncbi:MAG: hypothetical protein ACFB2X_24740 [Rivularia sp. (in: cyanobacteria)]
MLKTKLSECKIENLIDCKYFDEVLKQYRIGRVKPLELNLQKYGDSFTHPLFTKIESRLSYFEWSHFLQLGNIRENALTAVRRGEFDTAERLFTEARVPLKSKLLSFECKLLHETFLEQAQAYLDYCKGNFEAVYSRMFDAISIDMILEQEYNYDIMVIHRIQLLQNLMRTEARSGCLERAMEIASTLLGYLQGTIKNLCLFDSCGRESLNYQPKEVLADTFAAITSEIALILAGKEAQSANHLLAIALENLQLPFANNSCVHQQSYEWIVLKQAIVNYNTVSFLEKTAGFLALGRGGTPLLWYATVIDLLAVCKRFDFVSTKLIVQEVRQDAEKWELCSKRLLALID